VKRRILTIFLLAALFAIACATPEGDPVDVKQLDVQED